MSTLVFPDHEAITDLGRFATRARAVNADAALRIVATGDIAAIYAAAVEGDGLMGDGTVLGLRVMRLAEPADLDRTVPAGAIADRTARISGLGEPAIPLPPMEAAPRWAALAPPRHGWELVGQIPAEEAAQVATSGIAAVAEGVPAGAGALAVADLRRRVWAASTTTTPAYAAGLAFAAYALGFLVPGEPLTLAQAGRWSRLSSSVGHALAR